MDVILEKREIFVLVCKKKRHTCPSIFEIRTLVIYIYTCVCIDILAITIHVCRT